MIRIHCSTTTETDAAWQLIVTNDIGCPVELHLDGEGLQAIVWRDAKGRLNCRRQTGDDAGSVLHKAQPAHNLVP